LSIDDVLLRLDAAAKELAGATWAMQALVALATVCGLILWLSGARLLKPMIIILGALTGAAAGFIIGPAFGAAAEAGTPNPAGAYGLLLGLPAGALVGAVLYRSATAVALGVALAAAAPLCTAGFMQLHVRPTGEVLSAASVVESDRRGAISSPIPLAETLEFQLPRSLPTELGSIPTAIPEQLQPAADRAKEAIHAAAAQIEERFAAVPSQQRAMLVLSSLAGLAVGIVMGLMAPAWAAGACAAMLGSALWLGGGTWLSSTLGAPWTQSGGALDRPPMQWVTIWAAAAVLGLCFQGFWAWRRGK
jgi:hypothetical protein